MRYLALASDYDGTLAHDGSVDEDAIQSLERLVGMEMDREFRYRQYGGSARTLAARKSVAAIASRETIEAANSIASGEWGGWFW